MRQDLMLAVAGLIVSAAHAGAQVELKNYADAKGYLDVQKLTCAQLAGNYQQDADMLTTWYSGWYNGLAKKHLFHPDRAKKLEHEIIAYGKAHGGIRVIDAIAVVFNDERMRLGIQMKFLIIPFRCALAREVG